MDVNVHCSKCKTQSPCFELPSDNITDLEIKNGWLFFKDNFYCADCEADYFYTYRIETKVDNVWYHLILLDPDYDLEKAKQKFNDTKREHDGIQLIETINTGRFTKTIIHSQKIYES